MKDPKKQIDTLFSEAKNRGLRTMWTHYYRETTQGEKVLAATTCLLLDAENDYPVSKGVAVASPEDIPSKVMGRALSLKRAYAQYFRINKGKRLHTKGIGYLGRYTYSSMPGGTEMELTEVEKSRLYFRRNKKVVALQ